MSTVRPAASVAAALAAAAVSLAASAAEPPVTVTLLEGPGALLRGTVRYALAEGVRLQTGDIVEMGDKGVAQMEFADGLILSLGPRARFYVGALAPRGAKAGSLSELYLMRGWTKFASGKSAAPFRYTTPVFGLGTANAIAVAQVADGEGSIFVETGEVRVAEGFAKAGQTTPTRLKGGEFYARRADQRGTIQPRPAASFIGAMPKPYMDNLPARIAKYKDRDVTPKRMGDLEYADVEMWLKAPPEIRRPLMRQFLPKASEPGFRSALIANLRSHPEWDPILFPEKYKPKEPPEPKPTAQEAGAAKATTR